ncbi:MAG TPA: hypothetical protein VE398_15700 [Acidobacteriota bacterium]|nr:hypothetical protein [Acidobacteriota bacterium]
MKRFAAAISGAIFIVLIYFFIDGVAAQAWELSWHLKTVLIAGAFLAPVVIVTAVAIVFILRSQEERRILQISMAVLSFSLLCRVAWISTFDSYQLNDFGYYLNCGSDVALTGKPSDSHYCGPEVGYVYWKRAAFYTYPIVLLFGKSLLAVKLINVLLATLTAGLFFLAGRVMLGTKVSAIGLLFFIWHPDLWYAMTLASHDFPGLFWLSVFFYVCALLQRRLLNPSPSFVPVLGLSVLAGVSIFFLEVARSYHYGAILSLLIYATIHDCLLLTAGEGATNSVAAFLRHHHGAAAATRLRLKIAAIHTCLLLVIPLFVFLSASRMFWRSFGVQLEPDDAALTCYLTTMDVFGESQYEEIDNWLSQCPLIPGNDRNAFAIRKVLHDVTYDPREFLQHVVRKNRVLSRPDDYLNWSTSTEPETWDTTIGQVRRINHTHFAEQQMVIYIAHAAFLILVAWRFLIYPAVPFLLSEVIPLSFSSIYFSMFLFLLETQSRYEIFLIFVFPWMAAQAAIDLHRRMLRKSSSIPAPVHPAWVYCGGVCILVFSGCLFWSTSRLAADSFLTLRDQSGFLQVPEDELAQSFRGFPRVSPVFVANNHKQLMLAYPTGTSVEAGSVMAVQRTFTVRHRSTHHLRFFLSTYATRIEPYNLKVPWDDTPIEYSLAVNGQRVAWGRLADIAGNRYFSFGSQEGMEFGQRLTIQLILRNLARISQVDENRGPLLALEYIDLQ